MKIFNVVLPRKPSKLEDIVNAFGYLLEVLQRHFDSVANVVNGRISFGDGTKIDNIFGDPVDVTSGSTPDVEFSVSHSTGKIPGGFIVLWQDKAGSLYKGSTSWSSTAIYLKSNVASMTARIFII